MRLSTFMYYDFHQAGVYCRSNLQCYCYYIEFGGVTFFLKIAFIAFLFRVRSLESKALQRHYSSTSLWHIC